MHSDRDRNPVGIFWSLATAFICPKGRRIVLPIESFQSSAPPSFPTGRWALPLSVPTGHCPLPTAFICPHVKIRFPLGETDVEEG